MSVYKKFLKKEEKPFLLNITSMTDMFTILLVFLLQSYAAQTVSLEVPSEMKSPSAALPMDIDERQTIFIRQHDVLWNKKSLLTREELKSSEKRQQMGQMLKAWSSENPGKKIQLMADKNTSYAEIKLALDMVATAEIGEIRLVTLKGGQ